MEVNNYKYLCLNTLNSRYSISAVIQYLWRRKQKIIYHVKIKYFFLKHSLPNSKKLSKSISLFYWLTNVCLRFSLNARGEDNVIPHIFQCVVSREQASRSYGGKKVRMEGKNGEDKKGRNEGGGVAPMGTLQRKKKMEDRRKGKEKMT